MKKDRRWLQSAIAASRDADVRMPWQHRKDLKIAVAKSRAKPKTPALAAR